VAKSRLGGRSGPDLAGLQRQLALSAVLRALQICAVCGPDARFRLSPVELCRPAVLRVSIPDRLLDGVKDFDTHRVFRCPIARECDGCFRHVSVPGAPVLLDVVDRRWLGDCLPVDADGDVRSVSDESHPRRDAVV
jgi:hypothetical protein